MAVCVIKTWIWQNIFVPTFFINYSLHFRFIGEHLGRDGAVPEGWVPKDRRPAAGLLSLDPGLPLPMDVDQEPVDVPALAGAAALNEDHVAGAGALIEPEDHHVEDKVERQLNHLLSVFPNTDPGKETYNISCRITVRI